ncbi:MAG: class II aldolase/adducin family protein [Rhodocyclaceae bacterium]|nr:class II aldolase/adducin family protein [Rhodocyclaceae bacterium]
MTKREPPSTDAAAERLLATARAMNEQGLNRGTAGNVSVRRGGGAMLVTPSGLPFERCTVDDMVPVDAFGRANGAREASSEWRIHFDVYRAHPEAGAILHAHPPFATALACQRRPIPPFHYMVARFGGSDVRCAEYHTFGTQALSDAVVRALDGRRACLLANHGMVVAGDDLAHALALAIEFEALCQHYLLSCQFGQPVLLDGDEMREVIARFASYGQVRD